MGPGVSRFLLYLPILVRNGVPDDRGTARAALAKINNHGVRLVSGSIANEDSMRSRAVARPGGFRFDSVHVSCIPRAGRKKKRGRKQEREQD